MKITITIPAPPPGYTKPERQAVYLPFGSTLILVGECWVRAVDHLKSGGDTEICCHKEATHARP